jgi:hypothetical protein
VFVLVFLLCYKKIKKAGKKTKKQKKCMFVFISGIFLQRDGKA